jgi:hypothetical protein
MIWAVLYTNHVRRLDFKSSRTRRQIRRVARMAKELVTAIEQLDEPARLMMIAIEQRGARFVRGDPNSVRLNVLCRQIQTLADEASVWAERTKPVSRPRSGHRFRHPALPLLVEWLHREIVKKGGGTLTLSEDALSGRPTGTLPKVLEILRPYLPGVVPEHPGLSRKTLERMLRRPKNSPRPRA